MISLAARDIRHSWGKYVLTGLGLGLLIGVTLTMAGVFRGMVDDAQALLNNSGADLWVVQKDTQGPYAESSSLKDDVVRSVAGMPGVGQAANITYFTMQVQAQGGKETRAMVVGIEPGVAGLPGQPGPLVAGRHLVRSHYEAVADVKTGFAVGDKIRIRRHDYEVVGLARRMVSSGGDPMVLNNAKLAAWFGALAEAGIESIRVGTKEMAFYPQRFDDTFLAMLDRFHETYPEVGMHFMLHFEHPDEILAKDDNGNYIKDNNGFFQWVPETGKAMRGLTSRGWLSVENQAPIIKGINDDPEAIRTLQREFKRAGGENHYFFCGRDIVAYKSFNVPIESAWNILNESQKGLSGVECHARMSITHYKGKTEVSAVTNEPIPGLPGSENGVVIMKLLRNSHSAPDRGKVCIVGRNPDAMWFDDYEDRVLYDEAGLFEYTRVKKDAPKG